MRVETTTMRGKHCNNQGNDERGGMTWKRGETPTTTMGETRRRKGKQGGGGVTRRGHEARSRWWWCEMAHSRRCEPGRRGNDNKWEQEEGGDMTTMKGGTT